MSAEELAIEAQGLTRRFGKLLAVDGIDLAVPAGQIYGFLGPNGSGKSTTLRMLCGLLTPSAGTARVLGFAVPRDAERLKQHLGYMTQRFSLYEDLTVAENLRFVAEVYALPRRERATRLAQALQDYRLSECARQRAGTLSGGQKQRLALAAATLHRPRLLLLDEPTSAVDPQSRRDFWETLFALAEQGSTILVSTHYMDEAERCHRLAILDHGVKVADGSPRELSQSIGMQVLEVTAEQPNAARRLLAALPEAVSVTQLGRRLRVMVPAALNDPLSPLRAALATAGLLASVERVPPSLEDVFVAVTGKSRHAAPPGSAVP